MRLTWRYVAIMAVLCAIAVAIPSTGMALGLFIVAMINLIRAHPLWVCPRCGEQRWRRFTWAHRPAASPGVRTCGRDPVLRWRWRKARARDRAHAMQVMAEVARREGSWHG